MWLHLIRQLGALWQLGILKSQTYYQSWPTGNTLKGQVPLGVQIIESCSHSQSMSAWWATACSGNQDIMQEKPVKGNLLLQPCQ